MAITTENQSKSILANGLLSHVVGPTGLSEAASSHIVAWFHADGFPLPPEPPETAAGGYRSRRYDTEYRARFL
jgi:hypothetical protein